MDYITSSCQIISKWMIDASSLITIGFQLGLQNLLSVLVTVDQVEVIEVIVLLLGQRSS